MAEIYSNHSTILNCQYDNFMGNGIFLHMNQPVSLPSKNSKGIVSFHVEVHWEIQLERKCESSFFLFYLTIAIRASVLAGVALAARLSCCGSFACYTSC